MWMVWLILYHSLGRISDNYPEYISCPQNALRPKRLRTLISLYRSMGYNRRAGFIAWHALDQNLKSVNEPEFDFLLQSLRLQLYPSSTDPNNSIDSPDSLTLLPTGSGMGLPSSPNSAPPSMILMMGNVLRRPAQPVAVYPVMNEQIMAWYSGASSSLNAAKFSRVAKASILPGSTTRGPTQSKRSVYGSRCTGDHLHAPMIPDNVRFLPTGWAGLQAAVLGRIIDQFKMDLQFEDALYLPWNKALRLIGYVNKIFLKWHSFDQNLVI